MPIMEFPSGLALVRKYLNEALPAKGYPDVKSSISVPGDPRPPAFIVLKQLPTKQLNAIQCASRVLVECYAVDEVACDRLARRALAVLTSMEAQFLNDFWVYKCEESAGIVDNADYDRQLPRFQFEVSLVMRGYEL